MRPWIRPFSEGLYDLFENKPEFGKLAKIANYELKVWEISPKSPRRAAPKTFPGNRLKVEIYTDARAKPPFEKTSINWGSGIGVGFIRVVNGEIVEFFSLEANEKIRSWLKGVKSPRILIGCFAILWAYIEIRLWAPNRLGNQDLTRLAIPTVAENLGGDYILRKHYTSTRQTSWALQEFAAHSLTDNTTIISKRTKGDSRKWSIWLVGVSGNVYTQIDGVAQRAPDWGDREFWFTNIRSKSAVEILGALSVKDKKRLSESLPSKGRKFRS